MLYIQENAILRSWISLIESNATNSMSLNKFFGALEIISAIDMDTQDIIRSNYQYKFETKKPSNNLQEKFYFGNQKRTFSSTDFNYILFSDSWVENISDLFLNGSKLNINDVVNISLQNETFDAAINSSECIALFRKKFNLPKNYTEWFNDSLEEFQFSELKPNRLEIFNKLKLNYEITDNTNFTFGFEKQTINANPGEITRGPFIQPLYAAQEIKKCFILSNIDLSQYYKIYSYIKENTLIPKTYNKIIYGAPGTGKSYELQNQAKTFGFLSEHVTRVTFHPNYSYQHFVGTYKPSPIYKENRSGLRLFLPDKTTLLPESANLEPIIDYTFIPGPFLIQLINSINHPSNIYLLIIEEINRAAVSAVFGDVFQLLDRSQSGESQYETEFNADITTYLKSVGITRTKIKIPKNFYIWATMNSADQGVTSMDSAFKRRWSFEYLGIDDKQDIVNDHSIRFQSTEINWNSFRNKINNKLKQIGVSEDKLIGPFFLSFSELNNQNSIKNKLLLYLRDDVVRHNPEILFRKKSFSDIISDYDSGNTIFTDLSL